MISIAQTTEDDQHAEVRRAAEAHAATHGCGVILYPSDVASLLADPMPNVWDSEGEEEQFGNRLGPEDLDALGRAAIAEQIRDGRRSGLSVWAWLPKDNSVEALATYALEQGAHVVFVPESIDSIDELRARLEGTGEDAAESAPSRIELQVVPAPRRADDAAPSGAASSEPA